MLTSANAQSAGRSAVAPTGRSPVTRISPYPPIFRSTPDSITLTGVGASTWASGSQPCSGNTGIFTANPMKNPMNARTWSRAGRPPRAAAISAMSNERAGAWRCTATSATSMKTEPASV
jgi:hypothetical protein